MDFSAALPTFITLREVEAFLTVVLCGLSEKAE